ncbi:MULTISPECIES: ParB N-terminal domain-containing protein [unclassified Ensifer]|uniref:ParB N-terminal domain-containing protein n=1 Tax=unclassified Ensifer TaxID=2633371 RepID=UPI00081322A8|nr:MULTISPECIES: ParB N-terminal domain-containing protein [unclassified Ensifer]OCP17466.1 transcriptional regulator [Ensifer sp. LC54]OCP28628.1 transcriptional regulator [Ensifer sp. LC384]
MLKSLPISSILVADRARPVDLEHAAAIAGSMVDRGLINPITVRATPAAQGGKTPYTLVAGGHRLEAARMNGWEEIEAIVVSADAAEAQLIEISENLFRNDLSALDRAIFVMKFREIYEDKHGKIERGGDRKSKDNDCPLIFAPGKELSERVQERLGIGASTYKNVTRIGQKLHPMLRNSLRGTEYENDQKQLLKLAGLPEAEQTGIAAALKFEPDLKKVMGMDKPAKPAAPEDQASILKKLIAAWEKASDETRNEFLEHMGLSDRGDPLMREIMEDAA